MIRSARTLLCLVLGIALAGCWGTQRLEDLSPAELYAMAQRAVEKYRYEEAQKLIDRIRDDHPFSKFATEAELLEADMLFRQEKFEEAAAAYRGFEELHPTYPKLDYVIFRRGLCYYNLSQPPDRDQEPTHRALEAFQKLLYARPKSQYAAEAQEKVKELRQRLAEHEMYVARYYLRKKRYSAALGRLQELVRSYPDSPLRDQALALALEIQPKAEREKVGEDE
ncbi:outer membrane protein assembly factor BamD [Deferrisoma camini]|uniref:outer membrane protein assembly factor BamD n=1 Tax=Deferrisoma camini TaxID=1035120 RepID=UPI00046CE6F2|nr:outer membrane protein assembly factor BamD [Deferrisoma camini]